MYIKKSDVQEHGYALRCLGCISILREMTRARAKLPIPKKIGEGSVREYVEKRMEEDEQARKRKLVKRRRRKAKLSVTR